MIETNIRIVQPGPDLALEMRCLRASTVNPYPDLFERVCNNLRYQGIPAVVHDQSGSILAVASNTVSPFTVTDPEWNIDVVDEDKTERLEFHHCESRHLLSQVFERWLTIETRKRTRFWKLDSPRIFYVEKPCDHEDDIEVYRRFELSSIPIDSAGIGLIVEVTTAFFTSKTVADYFSNQLGGNEKERLRKRFERLAKRQYGNKGTLIYDTGRSKTKCYFDRVLSQPAGNVNVTVEGHTYSSLVEYYAQVHESLRVHENDLVALVSFPGFDRSKPVVAKFLKLRVSNEETPRRLKNLDKIDPSDRAELVNSFWNTIGTDIFGRGKIDVARDPWRPTDSQIHACRSPNLLFGNNTILSSPKNRDLKTYEEYFRKRLRILEASGCCIVPHAMVRRIQVAVPSDLSEEIVDHLSREIGDYLGTLTKKPVTAETIVYTDLEDVITRLQAIEPGVVLFIFKDDNPADYFNISYRLNKWRVHRITTDVLKSKFEKSLAELSLSARNEKDLTKVSRPWRSFVQLNALDLLQRLDCIPWIISDNLRYQMYVAIDVSKDGRYVGYSLFSNNARNKKTPFYLQTEVDVKADPKSETINHLHLKDKLISLFGTLRDLEEIVPITSLLFVRDGRFRGKEMEGISLAVNDLILQNIVSKDALIHFVNVHKQSVKGIRMWERTVDGKVGHLLEGTLMILDDKTAVLTNTGQATLHQGTADPILLIAQCGGMDIKTVAEDIHSTSQLNYSSPSVAQRLPIFLKRTDEELQGRESQEIRRLK